MTTAKTTRPKVKPLKDRKPRPKRTPKMSEEQPVYQTEAVAAPITAPIAPVFPDEPQPSFTPRPERQGTTDRAKRPTRQPLGMRNILTYPKEKMDPAYNYRYVNDEGNRLEQALSGGYEFVTSDTAPGDHRVAAASAMDSRVSIQAGGGKTAYLMREPIEFYREDQAEKQKQVDAIESAMKPDRSKSQYGSGVTNE